MRVSGTPNSQERMEMTTQQPTKKSPPRWWLIAAFVAGLVIMGLVAALLVNITTRKAEGEQYPLQIVEVGDDELCLLYTSRCV